MSGRSAPPAGQLTALLAAREHLLLDFDGPVADLFPELSSESVDAPASTIGT